jgi:hypothetical protein
MRSSERSRPAYGVRRLGPVQGLAQLAEATSLVLPPLSAFSHLTAARLLGLPLPHRWAPAEPLDVMARRQPQSFVELAVGDTAACSPDGW